MATEIPASITEQIENIKSIEISYRTLHTTADIYNIATDVKIIIPYMSLLSKYKNILSSLITTLELDELLYRQYLYNPKMFSYDLYGTTELWFELLRINNWTSIIEFKPKKLNIYEPDSLKEMINEIMILEDAL